MLSNSHHAIKSRQKSGQSPKILSKINVNQTQPQKRDPVGFILEIYCWFNSSNTGTIISHSQGEKERSLMVLTCGVQ